MATPFSPWRLPGLGRALGGFPTRRPKRTPLRRPPLEPPGAPGEYSGVFGSPKVSKMRSEKTAKTDYAKKVQCAIYITLLFTTL